MDDVKLCSRCKVNPVRSKSTKSGSSCKSCHADYMRKYAKRTGYKDAKLRKQRLRQMIIDGKHKPCVDCGVEYPWYVMDYDHVRGDKSFDLSRAAGMRISESRIVEEMAKCDVVCSNCHRERTYSRGEGNLMPLGLVAMTTDSESVCDGSIPSGATN